MQNFIQDETGAVTVDWVVLTAALVGLGLAVMAVVSGGVQTTSNAIDTQMTDGTVIKLAFTGDAQAALSSACSAVGVSCAGQTTGSDLANMTTDALNQLATDVDASGLATAAETSTSLTSAGFTQQGGEWGIADTSDPDPANHTFTADASATASFNQAVADDAYKASIAAEQGARTN